MVFDQTGQTVGRQMNYGVPQQALDAYTTNIERRLKAAEATGRAAVRALAYIRAQAPMHIGGEPHAVSAGGFYKADAVLATDTAQSWLAEQDATRAGSAAGEGM